MTSRIRSRRAASRSTVCGIWNRISKSFRRRPRRFWNTGWNVTRFPPGTGPLPWNRDRFLADLKTYTSLGMRHCKSFANGIDANYLRRHGEPTFLAEYGRGLENVVG